LKKDYFTALPLNTAWENNNAQKFENVYLYAYYANFFYTLRYFSIINNKNNKKLTFGTNIGGFIFTKSALKWFNIWFTSITNTPF